MNQPNSSVQPTGIKRKIPRDLPLAIKQIYTCIFWQQFWNHGEFTPTHLWEGGGYVEDYRAIQYALCGKRIAKDGTAVTVEAEEAHHLCKSCVRIALKRYEADHV